MGIAYADTGTYVPGAINKRNDKSYCLKVSDVRANIASNLLEKTHNLFKKILIWYLRIRCSLQPLS